MKSGVSLFTAVRGHMKAEHFVKSLQEECRDSAVKGCVEDFVSPPGRNPDKSLTELSKWFSSLADLDKRMVIRAMGEAADSTLFGVLCVLDGVRVIEDVGEKTEFQLIAKKGGKESIICPGEVDLHDLR